MIRRALHTLAAVSAATLSLITLSPLASGAAVSTPVIQRVGPDTPASAPAAVDQRVTIRHRDASGAITSVWHGPRWIAERAVATWRARSATPSGGVASPAIEQPPSCHLPTTYWVFRADTLVCYRYGGTATITIKNVYEVDSGNNAGYYVVGGTRYTVQKYVYDLWDPKVTVTQIHIN